MSQVATAIWAGASRNLPIRATSGLNRISSLGRRVSNGLTSTVTPSLVLVPGFNWSLPENRFSCTNYSDPDHTLARAVGVDTLVTFGSDCPGVNPEHILAEGATICDLPGALKPPYWIPATAALVGPDPSIPFVQPTDAQLNVTMALANAVPVTTLERSDTSGRYGLFAPSVGWVFIDRSWRPMWQTTVDGAPAQTYRALGGQVLFVGAGHHVIEQSMLPWDVGFGLLVALATILIAVLRARHSERVLVWADGRGSRLYF